MLTIKELVNQFKENFEHVKHKRYNETSLRQHYLDKLIEILGWDVGNKKNFPPSIQEVILEPYDKSYKRPDYAFTCNGIKKFFLEAKKPSVQICEEKEVIFQAKSYGWSAKHPIVVLSNFEYLIIYDTTNPPKIGDNIKSGLLYKYHYLEYEEKLEEIISILSRDTVFSGEFDKLFIDNKEKVKSWRVDSYFLNEINKWRLELAKYLYNEKSYSIRKINEVIQKFINQIIFLRFCEDRNLKTYHLTMQEFAKDKSTLKEKLTMLFEKADEKYNSGLFDKENLLFDLNNDIIFNIVNELYYPNSPYVFDVIESSLLGDIYELFLSEKIELDKRNKIVLSKKTDNSNRAIVTTPREIVKYMVESSISRIIEGKEFDEILNLKIADIACGSGIFLLETYEQIQNYLINKYIKDNPKKLIPINLSQYKLSYSDKKIILESCIFGIDIDFNAVEVAKFSLLLKLLENENSDSLGSQTAILPSLDENIKNGNSLIELNNNNENQIKEYEKLTTEEKINVSPFNWKFKNKIEKFDLILCNPPYVKTEDLKNLSLNFEMNIYENYVTAYKQFDKYFLFIERALEKINNNGLICFIIPNKFAKIEAGKKLRKLLAEKYNVCKFIDFNSIQLFEDKTIYSSILIVDKNKSDEFEFEMVKNLAEWWENTEKQSIGLKKITLSEKPWILCSEKREIELLNRLYSNSYLLEEIASPINGIQTSAEKGVNRDYPIYWFENKEILEKTEEYFKINRNNKEYKIERKILKPYFKMVTKNEKKLTSFEEPEINKWIIFPYDNKGKLYSLDTLREEYPETKRYFEDNYDKLVPKQISGNKTDRDVNDATEDNWYKYGRTQALTIFINTPKIIVKVMAKENPLYLLDEKDMIISSGGTAGCCAIILSQDSIYSLEFIQAILVHPAIDWLFSKLGSDFEGGFYTRGTNVLKRIPIVKIDLESNKNEYNKILDLIKKIKEINIKLTKKISTQEKMVYIKDIELYNKKMENMISKFYDILEYEDIYKRME